MEMAAAAGSTKGLRPSSPVRLHMTDEVLLAAEAPVAAGILAACLVRQQAAVSFWDFVCWDGCFLHRLLPCRRGSAADITLCRSCTPTAESVRVLRAKFVFDSRLDRSIAPSIMHFS